MYIHNNFSSKNIFLASQAALLAGLLLAIPSRLYPNFHPGVIDGLRGLLLAIGIGMLLKALWKNRRG
jgi:hypothetical protein